jgi:hypothetical protein
MRRMARKAMLSWIGLCLACSHPLGDRSRADAADVSPDVTTGPSGDAPTDMAGSEPDAVDPMLDTAVGESKSGADTLDTRESQAEAAVTLRDGFSSEGTDVPSLEVDNPWSDAGWIIDGPCSDYPSNLLQILATSLNSPFCARTGSSQPEGDIGFDSDGRVTSITGYRVPDDKDAWVGSLAAYRWPCLAGQTIAYGCS